MDNLNGNPLIDEDDDETAALQAQLGSSHDVEDESLPETSEDSSDELPDLDFGYTSSGPVRAPKLKDGSSESSAYSFNDDPDEFIASLSSYVEPEAPGDPPDDDAPVRYPPSDSPGSETSDIFAISDSIQDLENMTFAVGGTDNDTEKELYSSSKFGNIDYEEDDDDELAGFNLDEILSHAIDLNASDVHINPEDQVAFTILSDIRRISEFGIISPNITERLQFEIISNVLGDEFIQTLELDTSYVLKTGRHAGRRTRMSVGRSGGSVFMVFRVVADVIPTCKELGITGQLLRWTDLPNGLVMINGPVGTGKTTTLASLLKRIQMEKAKKIITIEKPIEFVYGTEGKGVVTQREVGIDTRSFAGALTSALRQAPDVLLIGEARDRTEFSELLRAAETGRLAFSTMHTNSAPATVNRIMGLFDGSEQARILGTLADVTRGFANQVLVKTPDGKGRFAVREVLPVDEEVSRFIMKGDVASIQDYQMHNKITMDHELVKAVDGGFCTAKEARLQSSNPLRFDKLLKELG